MKIKTVKSLIEYTRSMLGEPSIQVEVTDTQMEYIISDTIQKFTEYTWGDLEGVVIIPINGRGEYPLPNLITNILKISKGNSGGFNFSGQFGDGFVPDLWSEQHFSVSAGNSGVSNMLENMVVVSNTQAVYSKYFGDDLTCNFNQHRKILQVLEDYKGKVLLHYQYEYLPEEVDDIYGHEWVKAYVRAKTKQMWGTVVGKYDQALVGGARINYDRILSEATDEIRQLDEELLSKWCDVAPIMIG